MAARLLHTLRSALLLLLLLLPLATAQSTFSYTTPDGEVITLADNRAPALYTGNFGDCLGPSAVNVTRFDASFYQDNMTVAFHIAGNTQLVKESIMIFIGVYAYGESRFELAFDPCKANIDSLCPMQANVSIETGGLIPLSPADIANIPSIALSIPDFEGQAVLRMFANSTQAEIACYTAVVTNGASFSHPKAVGSIVGVFVALALAASFATTVYGDDDAQTRTHYAHSLSVLVVFAVLQSAFFTGALSVNWPSVLVAFWSNFAWASGMIYTNSMQSAIAKAVGTHRGNTTQLGAAGAGTDAGDVGGGYDIHKIYKRMADVYLGKGERIYADADPVPVSELAKRTLANSTTGFRFYGDLVREGLPLPGNYSGFAGTLYEVGIPASHAFLTGLIWVLIALLVILGCIALFKAALEILARVKMLKTTRLDGFRRSWLVYAGHACGRTLLAAFFPLLFLSLFQFAYTGSAPVVAVAAIVFILVFGGVGALAAWALYTRLHGGAWVSEPDRLLLVPRRVLRIIPWIGIRRQSSLSEGHGRKRLASLPWWRLAHTPSAGPRGGEEQKPTADGEGWMARFAWLAARFRAERWWFFAPWACYEFVRAGFYAGASGSPRVQVFGLLVVEVLAFFGLVAAKPFQGKRLNGLVVYGLGGSRVVSTALSAAFDGVLIIATMVAVLVGAWTSVWSVTRRREEVGPKRLAGVRKRYLAYLAGETAFTWREKKEVIERAESVDWGDRTPYFKVGSVRRAPKIEDEDEVFQEEIGRDPRAVEDLVVEDGVGGMGVGEGAEGRVRPVVNKRVSRAFSVASTRSVSSLPAAAVLARGSWSRDVASPVGWEGRGHGRSCGDGGGARTED
ncbi:TRP-domain-containing protein [Trichodelitschia bisporula]|uniref:TRP-domain-containing protein n=1 Tax=Trichodelitschia bisporula TaxID=703511 RepID=A0A6G1I9P0_9PEZI|nr:TRP-domain-containing protein [Trichodelitschia bisporula]